MEIRSGGSTVLVSNPQAQEWVFPDQRQINVVDTTAVQTLTNKTLTDVTALTSTGAVTADTLIVVSDADVAGTLSANEIAADYIDGNAKTVTTEFDVDSGTTGATLTNLTGPVFTLTAGKTYWFDAAVSCDCTVNGGIKLAFKYTTATLTSLEANVIAFAASSMATSRVTSTTDQASLIASKAAAWQVVRITGKIVVNVGGTVRLQAAQETAHADNTKVLVGTWMRMARID